MMGYDSIVEKGYGFIYAVYPRGSIELIEEVFNCDSDDVSLTERLKEWGMDQIEAHAVGDSRDEMDVAFLANGTMQELTSAALDSPKPEISAEALEQLQKVREILLARKSRAVSQIEWQIMESVY